MTLRDKRGEKVGTECHGSKSPCPWAVTPPFDHPQQTPCNCEGFFAVKKKAPAGERLGLSGGYLLRAWVASIRGGLGDDGLGTRLHRRHGMIHRRLDAVGADSIPQLHEQGAQPVGARAGS